MFSLSTLGMIHPFEKKIDYAHTQNLGAVLHTLGV
jgi:hypothetical protein